jgi:hypothetical protein
MAEGEEQEEEVKFNLEIQPALPYLRGDGCMGNSNSK